MAENAVPAKKMNLEKMAQNMKKAAPKEASKPQTKVEAPKGEKSWLDKHGAQLAIGALPTLLGAAFGGAEGGAIGAKVGIKGMTALGEHEKEARKSAKDQRDEEFKMKEFGLKKRDSESQRRLRSAQAKYYGAKGEAQKEKERKASMPKSFNDKVEGMGAEERKRFDSIRMGKNAVDQMKVAITKSNTFSLVGDNDYTSAQRIWKEAIGRMQSGGAINTDEEASFVQMAPTWADSKEQQTKKLNWLSGEMDRRMGTFGMVPSDIPDYGNPEADAYLQAYTQGTDIEFLEQALADPSKQMFIKPIQDMTDEEIEAELLGQ